MNNGDGSDLIDASQWTGDTTLNNRGYSIIGSLVQELVVSTLPPLGAIRGAVQEYLDQRIRESAEILVAKLQEGRISPSQVDAQNNEHIRMLFRYFHAATNGTARRNMELLAEAVASTFKFHSGDSDQFDEMAAVFEGLTKLEIILIAHMLRLQAIDHADMWDALRGELVPKVFENQEHLYSYAIKLQRTGLVQAEPMAGGMSYKLSQFGVELCSKASSIQNSN